MVPIDNNWTRHHRFLLRAFLTLVASFLLYFSFIRQVRIKINSELIYPTFVQYAESNNAKLIFLVQSSGIDSDKNIFLTSFSQKAKEQVKDFGAIVIDTREIFELYDIKKDLLFTETGVHFSEKGSEILSDFLYKKFQENNMIN